MILRDTYKNDDELFAFLESEGYDGSIGDMVYQYCVAQGLTGGLSDMVYQLNNGNDSGGNVFDSNGAQLFDSTGAALLITA